MKSFLFVLVQFVTLGVIALTGPLIPSQGWLAAVEFAGILLGAWAVLTMRLGNFNITSDVKPNSRLITTGPYAMIRHPMYAALLVATLPLLVEHFTVFRLAVWVLLLVDLVLKLNYEEGLLKQAHPDYAAYMEHTYRLIPFVY